MESRLLVSIPLALRYSWIEWLYSMPPETGDTAPICPIICGIAFAPFNIPPTPKDVANIADVAAADRPNTSPIKSHL